VIVGQPEFFQALDTLLTEASLDDWKAYLRFHVLEERRRCCRPRWSRSTSLFTAPR